MHLQSSLSRRACGPIMTVTALNSSYAYCERLARRQAGNFYPAFRILPADQRRAMCALYAFLRIADDLADAAAATETRRQRLTRWRQQFHECLTGRHSHRLHAALADTIHRFRIPAEYLLAVLDGVEMDLETVTYATFQDLYRYCYRVASAVGLSCIHIWGFNGQSALALAERAGIAFQLTNILRDLAEDAARDRIYLPQEELHRFGYSAEQLRRGERGESFRALMRFQVARARAYYAEAWPLALCLQPTGRAVFQVLMRTYSGLLDAIEQRDYDVFSRRVRLSTWRKLGLAARALPIRWGWV